jgi:hypothetical protein
VGGGAGSVGGGAAGGGSGGGSVDAGIFCSATVACASGCCDRTINTCVAGDTTSACGADGTDCVACASSLVCSGAPRACTCVPDPMTTTCAGKCGMVANNCGTVVSCGGCTAPQTCGGGGTPGVCGCTPLTCVQQGFDCGMAGDGCGGTLPNCGTCVAPQTCGGGGIPNRCDVPSCTPKTCASAGYNCGAASDGCGGVLICGPQSCGSTGQVCGAQTPNVCGTPSTCTGLCLQQQSCPGGGTTTLSGKVFAPNGVDPLYGVLVYVPNGGPAPTFGVQPFTPGVHCGACGVEVTGSPLVSTVTAVDGSFTLSNMPAGANIPLVIQTGRWRRQFVVPNVAACTTTTLPSTGANQVRLPRAKSEGDIPLIAVVTGASDAVECVFRKIGVSDTEFSNPLSLGGTGRINFFSAIMGPGALYTAGTPNEGALWGTQAAINVYDMVLFGCQGNQYNRTAAQQQTLINFANAGGRIFTDHYGYVWLFNDAPFSATATWNVNQFPNPADQAGYVNLMYPPAGALASWLQLVGATTTLGQIPISTLRSDFTGVVAPTNSWISINDINYPPGKSMHFTFNTPVGVPPSNQCGKVLFEDYHVEAATITPGTLFPAECTTPTMTAQEKLLEFSLFDLGSCVAPAVCTSLTCAQANSNCGPTADGCGNIMQCGSCPTNQACVGGICTPNCNPTDCAAQGFMCGEQSDGCGNVQLCGACPGGETCVAGQCSAASCTPQTCNQLGAMCGTQGDGCGGSVQCGNCPTNQTCERGVCRGVGCAPMTCAKQGFNCGMATDGCGTVINCGNCPPTQVCGAGGAANVCGSSG